MATKITVTGISELNNTLKNIPKELIPKVMTVILEVSRVEVETKAKYAVPVDTGRLRASIHTMEAGTGFQYTDRNGKSYDGRLKEVQVKQNQVAVGTNVNYANKIHKRGGTNGKGKEFLKIAFQNARSKYIDRIKKVLP